MRGAPSRETPGTAARAVSTRGYGTLPGVTWASPMGQEVVFWMKSADILPMSKYHVAEKLGEKSPNRMGEFRWPGHTHRPSSINKMGFLVQSDF